MTSVTDISITNDTINTKAAVLVERIVLTLSAIGTGKAAA
jgi:hypothetical protein